MSRLVRRSLILTLMLTAAFCAVLYKTRPSRAALAPPVTNRLVANRNDSGSGSLRQAISDANISGGTITFAVTGTISLLSKLEDLQDNVIIQGPGPEALTIERSSSATTPFRIFTIPQSAHVSISGLTIANGNPDGCGGCIPGGGGILNRGHLTMTDCVITGNTSFQGAGIMVQGGDDGTNNSEDASLVANNCTISNNSGGGIGTALYIRTYFRKALVTLNNCTISGNVITSDLNLSQQVLGAIYIRDIHGSLAQLTMTNVTMANNAFGALIVPGQATKVYYQNSILDDGLYIQEAYMGSVPDLPATTSLGFNTVRFRAQTFSSGFTRGNFSGSGDKIGVDPRLAPLGDYGGHVPTHALYYDSLAIDAGSTSTSLSTDARGLPRMVDGNADSEARIDIGAYEKQRIVVTNTNDSGAGSLRQAIVDNNNRGGGNLVTFDIPGDGVKTITPSTSLPVITTPIDINGYTQFGAFANSLAVGDNASLRVELNGTNAGNGADGLSINSAAGVRVAGLAINRFKQSAIRVGDSTDVSIQGNFIGTNASGTSALGNNLGVYIFQRSSNNCIGLCGSAANSPGARNVIAGNLQCGVRIEQDLVTNNTVAGNYIGVDASGNGRLNNVGGNVQVRDGATNNTIGGSTANARNVISVDGNIGVLIEAPHTSGNTVAGNSIGVGADGTSSVGNASGPTNSFGIRVRDGSNNTIGGNTSVAANTIANVNGYGVAVRGISATGNRILSNSIYDNALLGIDLAENSVTPNDNGTPPDSDVGPNNLQNFPVLTSALNNPTTTVVSGTLNTAASNAYTLQFFVNNTCDASGSGEGRTLVASLAVTTDANGAAAFGASLSGAVAPLGNFVTATATNNSTGDTSEFSQCAAVVADPNGSVQFSSATYSVVENGGTASITVTRSGEAPAAISVHYQTVAGTTTPGATCGSGADYITTAGTLSWAAGDTNSQTFTVPICNDVAGETNQTVNLWLTSPTGGVFLGTQSTAVLTITDDDNVQVVTNLNDSGPGSLRAAIGNANASSTITAITFADNLQGTITLQTTLTLSANTTIVGPGADLITVSYSVSSVPTLSVTGVDTISGLTFSGHGVHNHNSLTLNDCVIKNNIAPQGGTGGGVVNYNGTLTINDCTIKDNASRLAEGGGGVVNYGGTTTINNSTISNNLAKPNVFSFGLGGGIWNAGGTVNLNNSTVSGNSTGNTNSGGGGICNGYAFSSDIAILNVSHSTIAFNTGGGVLQDSGSASTTATFSNTIVSNNTATNFAKNTGSFTLNNYNLSDSWGSITPGATDVTGDPLLAPLADNGGSTQTHALLNGSAAIDKGQSFSVLIDQRHIQRPVDLDIPNAANGNGSDIGACEAQTLPANEPPVAASDSYTLNEDANLVIGAPGVLANDTDIERNSFTAVLVSNPSHGNVILNANGGFNYTPFANYNGSDSFTYKANDGADSNMATVSLTIAAQPETLVVTKTADTNDGACDSDCSLREAIAMAGSGDTITFASPLFDSPRVITLSSAVGFQDLKINKSVIIVGRGAALLTVRRSPAATTAFRIFTINGATVGLSGMTITGGNVSSQGGGLSASNSTVTVTGCNVRDNSSGLSGGGMIILSSTLNLVDSTVANNSADIAGGGISGNSVNITNSTISANVANRKFGGGLFIGNATISNSTITDNGTNEAGGAGGVYTNSSSPVTVRNSIIAGNRNNTSNPDISVEQSFGSFASQGNNLIGNVGNVSAFNQPTDKTGNSTPLDPRLGPLAYYGGQTPTHALLSGSPAIDAGNNSNPPANDQRGLSRVVDGDGNGSVTIDIGAFELNFNLVNMSPLNIVPGAQTTALDAPLIFSSDHDNALSIFDSDAGTGLLQVTINVDRGTFKLGPAAADVTVTGDNSPSVTVTGNLSSINTKLDGSVYTPAIPGTATLTIITNDNGNTGTGGSKVDTDSLSIEVTPATPRGEFSFSQSNFNQNEDVGPVTITVLRSNGATGPATVNYRTEPWDGRNAAGEGVDYEPTSGTLFFADGETEKTFPVEIVADSLLEGNELVSLVLSEPTGGATLGTQSIATLTIINDDGQPTVGFSASTFTVNENDGFATITVNRVSGGSNGFSVHYATRESQNGATANEDFTPIADAVLNFAEGESSKTFTVAISDDTLFEPNEPLVLQLGSPAGVSLASQNTTTLTINDNDSEPRVQFGSAIYRQDENGATATITVTRSGGSNSGVSVQVETSDGSATAGFDYVANSGTLQFDAGETEKTFTVALAEDSLFEGDETINLSLSSPLGATLGTPEVAVLTITDNDGPPVLQFSAATYGVVEGDPGAVITVTRSGGSNGGITLDYATTNGTAGSEDYTTTSGSLTFAAGETSKTFTIPIADDLDVESAETVNIELTNPTGGAILGVQTQAVLTITDNDTWNCAADVTAQLTITRGGFSQNFVTKRFRQTVTIRNTSSSSITGPLAFVVDGLSPNAVLYGPAGMTTCALPLGSPYVNLNIGTDNVLSAGETITVVLEFTNATPQQSISYGSRILAGPGTN